jgi:hypothetical protein
MKKVSRFNLSYKRRENMRPKILKFLPILFVVFGILVAQGFSATAPQKPKTRHISEDIRVDAAGWEMYRPLARAYAKYPVAGAKLGCLDIQPEVGTIIQHDQIGDTWYDFQKNGSMGRMISVTNGGYRHFSWTCSDHPYPLGPRGVDASCSEPALLPSRLKHASADTRNGFLANHTV